jgi:hypothetical protein
MIEFAEINKSFWVNSEAILSKIISRLPQSQAVSALKFLLSEFSNRIIPLLQKSKMITKVVESKITFEIIDLLYNYVKISHEFNLEISEVENLKCYLDSHMFDKQNAFFRPCVQLRKTIDP